MSPAELPSEAADSSAGKPEPVTIEAVRVGELVDFVECYLETGSRQTIAPLTRRRALSHSRNPYARPDDTGLLVAYAGETCVGYQGLLPVSFLGTDGERSSVAWSTSMFVAPEYRARLVALQLVRAAIDENVDLVLNEFSEEAARLFRGLRFQEMPALAFLRLRVDLLNVFGHPFQLLGRQGRGGRVANAAAARGLWLTRRTGYLGIRPLYYAVLRRLMRHEGGFRYRVVERVRELPPAELEEAARAAFVRDVDAINWMLETPWVRDDAPPTVPSFYFADSCELFRYIALEILDADERYRGFAVLSVRKQDGRTTVKLLDHELARDVPLDVVRAFVLRHARTHRADVVEWPETFAASLSRVPLRQLVLQTIERPYLCRPSNDDSPLAVDRLNLRPALHDGDTAFW